MKLKMINDYVLVEMETATTLSTGGIILTNSEPPCVGTVVSVGQGKYNKSGFREEHNIEVGDKIVFGKPSLNRPLEEDGKTYYVMQIDEIYGKKS